MESLVGSMFSDNLTLVHTTRVNSRYPIYYDTIDGRAGNDVLTGSANFADHFTFSTTLGADNIDTVTNFQPGTDKVYLDHTIFTGLATGVLAAGAFDTGAAASDADDRIIYNSSTGALYFDSDGTGSAAQVQFATLSPGLSLSASSFVVT